MKRLGLLLLTACQMPLGANLDAVPINPDPSWRVEWNWTWHECGSRSVAVSRVTFEAIQWWQISGGDLYGFQYGETAGANGFYDSARHVIGLAPYVVMGTALDASWSRRHEMLHAQTGIRGHPENVFERCERLAVVVG